MSYRLFLDDERVPGDVTWVDYHSYESWKVVRTFDEFVERIKNFGMPSVISFDHDLGPGDGTGFKCAKWLVDYIIEENIGLPEDFRYYVHSKNPVGAANIRGLMDRFIEFYKSNA